MLVQVILDVAAIIGFCSILEPLWSIKEFMVSLQSLQFCVRKSTYSTRYALYWSKNCNEGNCVNPGFLLELIFSRQSQLKGLSLVLAEEYELYVKVAFTSGLISS